MSRNEFESQIDQHKAAFHRLRDAKAIFDTLKNQEKERSVACVYLAGYAIECRLKDVLLRSTKQVKTKTLSELGRWLEKSGKRSEILYKHDLLGLFDLMPVIYARFNREQVNKMHFSVIRKLWRPSLRYRSQAISLSDTSDALNAVEHLDRWLRTNA